MCAQCFVKSAHNILEEICPLPRIAEIARLEEQFQGEETSAKKFQ